MDPGSFLARSRVVIVAGKGGVGKSTLSAVLARLGVRHGLRVLVVELEGRTELPHALGIDGALDWEEHRLEDGRLDARRIRPDDALIEWLRAHSLGAVVRRLRSSGALEVVSFAVPGIREVLVLGKLKALERSGAYDLIVLDAPATGHALTLLTSPAGLRQAARSGPIRRNAEEVCELLADPARCRVVLVTLPRELAVDETIEAAYEVEDRAGVALGEVVVNQFDPPDALLAEPVGAQGEGLDPSLLAAIERARSFEAERRGIAADELARLGEQLALPQLWLPRLDAVRIGLDETERLADALDAGIRGLA